MAQVKDHFDEDDDGPGVSDREAPDPSDMDDSDDEDEDTTPCPYCGKSVYEQAEVCPYCHNYISREDAARRYPWWIWVGIALCLLGVVSYFIL